MAAVEPYAPCPCGSGEKFKWCCQKVEAYADKADRLFQNGQIEAAHAALDEGLRKAGDNAWLLTRKAIYLINQDQVAEARPLLERVVQAQPGHVGAHSLLVRATLETSGAEVGVIQLQHALAGVKPEDRPALAPLVQVVGMFLAETGHPTAAVPHLELARRLLPEGAEDDPVLQSAVRMAEGNAGTFPWLREPWALAPAPFGLDSDQQGRFDEALAWAEAGLWSAAAATFDTLSADGIRAADRNLGLCRLWLLDDAGAVEALRRYIGLIGPTPEAVDLEALCQLIAPPGEDDLADRMHLIWPLKKRDELLAKLNASDVIKHEGRGPLDPDDPKSFEVDDFLLLDRPRAAAGTVPDRIDTLPRVVARVLVASEIVILDTVDDGGLDPLIARFVDLAGGAIPPAHPKTKVVDKVDRAARALRTEWLLPEGIDPEATNRLLAQERARVVREVWPTTREAYLGGRTPRQAAADGDAQVALRAAVCVLEVGHEFFRDGIDFAALRSELKIEDEPAIDPESVDIGLVTLARLHRVPADRLDDDRLVAMWDRARRYMLPMAMERAATAIADRPALLGREDVGRVTVFADLANLALSRRATAEAFEWLGRGRRSDPSGSRGPDAVRWDMLEVRLRARSERPEAWVPQLAVVLERHRQDQQSGPIILSNLMDMGLVRMVPNPDNPEEVLLDSRGLSAVLARYGPKVTTATGELGVSATGGQIWTPGSDAPGGGGLWTPGAGAGQAPGGEKKLIIPGR